MLITTNIARAALTNETAPETNHPVQKLMSSKAIEQFTGQPAQAAETSLVKHATVLPTDKPVSCPIHPDPDSAEIKEPTPAPEPEPVAAPAPAEPTLIDKGTFKLTFYDPAVLGATSMPGGMYAGVAAHLGVIPRGSQIKITLSTGEVWYRVINDTGTFAASNSQQLDVAMPNCDIPSAGVLNANVQIVQPA